VQRLSQLVYRRIFRRDRKKFAGAKRQAFEQMNARRARRSEALRNKLSSYSRRKYSAQEAEAIRSAVEGVVVELVAAAAQAGREPPVEFNEVAIQSNPVTVPGN